MATPIIYIGNGAEKKGFTFAKNQFITEYTKFNSPSFWSPINAIGIVHTV